MAIASVSSNEIVSVNPEDIYQSVQSAIFGISASLTHLLTDGVAQTFKLANGETITIFKGDL
jgi:hypothetical protein